MGCHTWFYQQSNRTFEEAKQLAKAKQEAIIEEWSNPDIKNKESFKAYGWNELTRQETLWHHQFLLDRINDGCEYTIWNNQPEDISYYNPVTKKFYIDGKKAHDIIRVGNYPDIKFFSFEEMIEWIEEHRNDTEYNTSNISQEEIERLKSYWQKYPTSMVCFG